MKVNKVSIQANSEFHLNRMRNPEDENDFAERMFQALLYILCNEDVSVFISAIESAHPRVDFEAWEREVRKITTAYIANKFFRNEEIFKDQDLFDNKEKMIKEEQEVSYGGFHVCSGCHKVVVNGEKCENCGR